MGTERRAVRDPEDFMRCVSKAEFPQSYTDNTREENHLLFIADSFQRHFSLLYLDRRPLLLCLKNECGVKKFVSTSLRPTLPGLADLYTWQQCASFVSNFLTLQPLDKPTELPTTLRSPQTVLQSQCGSSLEYANLLCSLLLGLNYNAYCVSGYACRYLCELDRSQERCPLLDQLHNEESGSVQPSLESQDEGNKYNVRRGKKLQSNFLLKQEKKQKEQQTAQPHNEPVIARDPDPLWGLRVHFWVLVLAGSGHVEQDFFIEPLTGNYFPTHHRDFLGVESVWNELNVYVNMQDCDRGCQDLLWDPENQSHWEPLVYGTTSRKQLLAAVLKKHERAKMGLHEDQDEEKGPVYVYDMPLSWCRRINITDRDLEMCWPGGFKEIHFKQALVENYIPFFRPDGVITCLTLYSHHQRREVEKVKVWFQNRADLLMEREVTRDFTIERFRRGRQKQLLYHRFNTSIPEACPSLASEDPGVTPEREMRFAVHGVDDLVQRLEHGNEMIENFENRQDFLFQRHILFADPLPGTHPTESSNKKIKERLENRPILKVVEHFHRNPSKAASEDVAERVFLLAERRIEVTYHLEENHFIPPKRSFLKPTESTRTQKAGDFTMDMVTTFQVDHKARPLNLMQLFEIIQELMSDENKTMLDIRNSQKLVQSLVLTRAQEEKDIKMEIYPWTTQGTTQARVHRERMMLLGEELRWLEEQQKDLLAPVLFRLSGGSVLTPDQAQTVYQTCLQDFKSRMVQQAWLIQRRYEENTRELEMKQRSFQEGSLNFAGQESEHKAFCAEKTRQINVAQKRLQMHKDCAPQKYRALEQKLRADPRIGPYLKAT